jgi:hypothetical protein
LAWVAHCPKEINHTSLLHLTMCIAYRAALVQIWSDGKNNCQHEVTYYCSTGFSSRTTLVCNWKISILKWVKILIILMRFKNVSLFFEQCWFLARNLSSFVSLARKLDNRYYTIPYCIEWTTILAAIVPATFIWQKITLFVLLEPKLVYTSRAVRSFLCNKI